MYLSAYGGLWGLLGWEHAIPDHLARAFIATQAPTLDLCSDALVAGFGSSMAWWPFCLFYPAGVIGLSGYLSMLVGSIWWGYRVPVSQTVTPTGRLTHITHASQTDKHAHKQ